MKTTDQMTPSKRWRAYDRDGAPVRPPSGHVTSWAERHMRCECGATLWVDASTWCCTRGHEHGPAFTSQTDR